MRAARSRTAPRSRGVGEAVGAGQGDLREELAVGQDAARARRAERVSASLRSMLDSLGSLSRSSTRVPNCDWVAMRTSFQRSMPATTWMP